MHLTWVGKHCEGDQERMPVLCAAGSSMQGVRVRTCILCDTVSLSGVWVHLLRTPTQAKKPFLILSPVIGISSVCVY